MLCKLASCCASGSDQHRSADGMLPSAFFHACCTRAAALTAAWSGAQDMRPRAACSTLQCTAWPGAPTRLACWSRRLISTQVGTLLPAVQGSSHVVHPAVHPDTIHVLMHTHSCDGRSQHAALVHALLHNIWCACRLAMLQRAGVAPLYAASKPLAHRRHDPGERGAAALRRRLPARVAAPVPRRCHGQQGGPAGLHPGR